MGRRRHQRFKKDLTVQIHGTDSLDQTFSQTATVVDVSESGVRLQGVRVLYRTGQMVTLEHQGNKARYRVVWVGSGSLTGHAGLMTLEPHKSIFNVRFPPSSPDKYVVPPPEAQDIERPFGRFDEGLRRLVEQRRRAERRKDERRNYPRYSCNGEAELYVEGAQFPQRGRLSDLSRGGCFLELLSSFTIDTKVTLVLAIWQRRIRTQGVVRSVLPNFGLGIQFLHVEPSDLEQLDEVLAALEEGRTLGAAPSSQPAAPPPPPAPNPTSTPVDPQRAIELVKSWFGDHDHLTRQEFLDLLKKVRSDGP